MLKKYETYLDGLFMVMALRYAIPVVGAAFWGSVGFGLGVGAGYLCHIAVRSYVGVRPFRIKQIESERDFVPLRQWMVPKARARVVALCYEAIEKKKSARLTEYAKKIVRENGYLTRLEYANAMLLYEQLWYRLDAEDAIDQAEKEFVSKN